MIGLIAIVADEDTLRAFVLRRHIKLFVLRMRLRCVVDVCSSGELRFADLTFAPHLLVLRVHQNRFVRVSVVVGELNSVEVVILILHIEYFPRSLSVEQIFKL